MTPEEQQDYSREISVDPFTREPQPLEELQNHGKAASAGFLCVDCGIFFNKKIHAKSHRREFEHDRWLYRPRYLNKAWKDPYAVKANPTLKKQRVVINGGEAASERKAKLRTDMT